MVDIITDVGIFIDELKNCNVSNNPFLTYEYYKEFQKKMKPMQFRCFRLSDSMGRTKALLPLEKATAYWRIYGYRASNYLGIIASAGSEVECLKEIEDYIQASGINMTVCFYDINNKAPEYSYFHSQTGYREVFLYECPAMDVNRNFSEIFTEKISSSKKRAELKKFRKKLNLLGTVAFVNVDNEEKFIGNLGLLQQMFSIHKKRFSSIYPPDEYCFYSNETYYTELLHSLVKSGKAIISLMSIDGILISFLVTLVEENVVVDWMPAFDPCLAKYSVGNVHLIEFMESLCCDSRYTTLDFSKGLGTYKDRWMDYTTSNYAYVVCYGHSLLESAKFAFVTKFFELKSWLRERGLLEKIKAKRVAVYARKNTNNNTVPQHNDQIKYAPKADRSGYIFSYADIKNCSDAVRKELVELIYSGAIVLQVECQNEGTVITLEEKKSEV